MFFNENFICLIESRQHYRYLEHSKMKYPMLKRNFPPQFKQEVAELVVDRHYTHAQEPLPMGASIVSVQCWAKQLR